MTGARSRTGRVRFLDLPDDPEAAFQVRAAVDREALITLMQSIRDGVAPSRMKRCLADLEDLAHGLAGTGGVFGFPQVSTVAARLERLAERYARLAAEKLERRRVYRLTVAIEGLIAALNQVPGRDA